jgi:hypothetical protein
MSYIGIPPFGQTVRTVTTVTATAGQTTFNITGGYIVGYVDVFLNGVLLAPSDITATDGLTVVLNSAAALNDEFQAVSYQPVSLADTYRKAEVDSLINNIDALPSQTGQSGKYLTTDGTDASWGTVDLSSKVSKSGDTMSGALGVVAGTNSAPGVFASGDTNTGIFFPAADTIAFAEGGAEAMRIDSSGNVGIGTTSPAHRLHVNVATNPTDANDTVTNAQVNTYGVSFRQKGNNAGISGSTFPSQIIMTPGGNAMEIYTIGSIPMVFGTNTLERMRIDTSGRVTMPYQPAFQVENIASRIAAGSVVPWSAVISNRGSHYNSSTHRFTAPVAGYYQFNLSAFTVRTTSTGDYYWDIRKNGTLKFRVYQAKTGNADMHAQAMGAITVELSANDYVDVSYSFGAVSMETGASHNNFSGYLIG